MIIDRDVLAELRSLPTSSVRIVPDLTRAAWELQYFDGRRWCVLCLSDLFGCLHRHVRVFGRSYAASE